MEVTGKVVKVFPKNQVSDKFSKRDIVIETSEDYPQLLSIQFVQDKCEVLDNIMEGENVKIGINLRGRAWTNPQGETKYFNTIQGWYIDNKDQENFDPEKFAKEEADKVFEKDIADSLAEDQQDDLPF